MSDEKTYSDLLSGNIGFEFLEPSGDKKKEVLDDIAKLMLKYRLTRIDVYWNILPEPEYEYSGIFAKLIWELELTIRTENCLKREKIQYIGELVGYTEKELMKIANFGKISLQEIKDVLKKLDLSLGMTIRKKPANEKLE